MVVVLFGVCVIIPTLNEEKNIGILIDSIKKTASGKTEIVVVDDGSTDHTREIAFKKGAIILENTPRRQGPAFGWNRVAHQTKMEILCILGADFLIEDKNFFKKSLDNFQQDKSIVAIRTSYTTKPKTLIEKIVTKKTGNGFEPRFIRRDVFLEIGGFPQIGFGEDQVFVEKLEKYCKETSKKFVFLKDVYFSGHGVQTLEELYKQGFWYGKTSLPFLALAKNPAKQAIFVYLRAFYLLSFILLLFSLGFPVLIFTGLPFFVVFLSKVVAALREKNPYVFLQVFTYLVSGIGIIHGFFVYALGIDRKSGY